MRLRSVFDAATELVVEVHFGEGGQDSKQFVGELFSAYARYGESRGFRLSILDSTHGHIVGKFVGQGVWQAFKHEAGQHAVQRYPETERGGRRHTSLVSVAVLPLPPERTQKPLPPSEVEMTITTGSGPGGQARNKTETAVRLVHKPTGLVASVDSRDQGQNKKEALRILTAKVNELRNNEASRAYGNMRQAQLGGGNRGKKIRTYNFIDSRVTDHQLNTKTSRIDEVMRGKFSLILK